MPWETRERGGLYYTRSRRDGERVVREYIGGGELGRIVSKGDAMRRAALEAKRKREREELERLKTADAEVEELYTMVDTLMSAALVAAGYRNHKGEWRLRRGGG
jgi:hypothetical protein